MPRHGLFLALLVAVTHAGKNQSCLRNDEEVEAPEEAPTTTSGAEEGPETTPAAVKFQALARGHQARAVQEAARVPVTVYDLAGPQHTALCDTMFILSSISVRCRRGNFRSESTKDF